MTIEEFAREFLQDVLAESDADGEFLEDVFFQKSCEHLMEAGELDSADRAPYLGPPGRGIRVDGYGGDPAVDGSDTLCLLVLDFQPSPEIGRLVGTEMNAIFRRLMNFLRLSLEKKVARCTRGNEPGVRAGRSDRQSLEPPRSGPPVPDYQSRAKRASRRAGCRGP